MFFRLKTKDHCRVRSRCMFTEIYIYIFILYTHTYIYVIIFVYSSTIYNHSMYIICEVPQAYNLDMATRLGVHLLEYLQYHPFDHLLVIRNLFQPCPKETYLGIDGLENETPPEVSLVASAESLKKTLLVTFEEEEVELPIEVPLKDDESDFLTKKHLGLHNTIREPKKTWRSLLLPPGKLNSP